MKTKFILSCCALLFFALLAGGSADTLGYMLWIALVGFGLMVIFVIVQSSVKSRNKKKRLSMIKQEEATAQDFDRTVNFGNDRCKFYFDSVKKQVMIMRVMTEGINKTIVDGFEYGGRELCAQRDPYFCLYDFKNRNLLYGDYENVDVNFKIKSVSEKDKNKDVKLQNAIKAKLLDHKVTNITATGETSEHVFTLVDEQYGMMAILRKGLITSEFNYIRSEEISKKIGVESFISSASVGNYQFIMDDFFNVLVMVTPGSYEIFNYKDIIEVSYEENGTLLYSKSAMRTVGGAIVGGALMGGAGAVVGGLSGATTQNKEVRTMTLKILLRSTEQPTYLINFNESKRILKTNDKSDAALYKKYQRNANKAKDILSVIIDKVKQEKVVSVRQVEAQPVQQSTMADELAKLAKLKSEGILTEEEFNAQKSKLLNS